MLKAGMRRGGDLSPPHIHFVLCGGPPKKGWIGIDVRVQDIPNCAVSRGPGFSIEELKVHLAVRSVQPAGQSLAAVR
eukprot:10796492-Heterocapsa_arctica.AAC.1